MIILTYHTVSNPKQFERQIQWLLEKHYNPISITQFLKLLESDKLSHSEKYVLITFDDGDITVYNNAYPILKKYNIPSLLFVITDLIATNKAFWWDEINHYSGKSIPLRNVKSFPNNDRLALIDKLRKSTVKPALQQQQLSWEQLEELDTAGMAIANHSHTHPMFDKISNEEIAAELTKSKDILEQKGFKHANIFAYPNGNYNNATLEVLKAEQFKAAFMFDHKTYNKIDKANPFKISRLSVNDFTPIWKFKLIVSGYHTTILNIRKKIGI